MTVIGSAEILVKANDTTLVPSVKASAEKAGAVAAKSINSAVTGGFKSAAGSANAAAVAIAKPYLDAAGRLREANGRFASEATKAAFAAANGQVAPTVNQGAVASVFSRAGRVAGAAFSAGVEASTGSVRGFLDGVLAQVSSFGDRLRAIARPVGLVSAAVAGGFGVLAGIGIRTAASLEQAQVGFDALLGSAEAGRAFFQELIQLANVSAFEVGQITGPAQTLLAVFPKNAPAATAALKTVVDAVALLGKNSPEALQRLTDGFGKAASQGKFQAESLNIIGEAIPGFSARLELARAVAVKYGIDQAAATKRIEAGMVSAAEGTELLLDRLRAFPGLAGAALAQSKTLGGVLSTFSDTVKSALAFNLAGPLIPGIKEALIGITEPIGTALASIGTGIAPVLNGLVPQVVGGLRAAFAAAPGAVVPLVNAIARIVGSLLGALPRALASARAVFAAFAVPIRQVAQIIGTAFPRAARTGFGPITVALLGLAKVLAVVAPAVAKVGVAIAKVALAVPVLAGVIRSNLTPVLVALGLALAGVSAPVALAVAAFVGLGRVIQRLSDSTRVTGALVREGARIAGAFNSIRQSFAVAAEIIAEGFRTAGFDSFGQTVGVRLPSLVDVLVGAINLAVIVAEGLAKAVDTIAAAVTPVIVGLTLQTREFVDKNGPAIAGAFDAIGTALGGVRDAAGGAAEKIGPFLADLAKNQKVLDAAAVALPAVAAGLLALQGANTAATVISGIGAALEGLSAILAGGVALGAAGTIGLIAAAVAAVGTAAFLAYRRFQPFRDVVDTVGRFIRTNLRPILIGLGAALVTLSGPIGIIVGGLAFLVTKVQPVRDIFRALAGFVTGTLVPAFVDAGERLGGVWDTVTSTVSTAFARVQEIVSGAIEAVTGLFGRLAEVTGPIFAAVQRGVASFVDWFQANVAPTIGAGVEFVVALFARLRDIAEIIGRVLAVVLGPPLRFLARVFADIAQAVGAVLVPALRLVARLIGAELAVAFRVLQTTLRTIGVVFRVAFGFAADAVATAFRSIKAIIEGGLRVLRGIFQVLTGILTLNWSKAWEGIKNIVGGVFDTIVSLVGDALDLLGRAILRALGGLKDLAVIALRGLVDVFGDLVERIPGIFGALGRLLGTILVEAIKFAGRFVRDSLRFILDGFTSLIGLLPDAIGDVGGKIVDLIRTGIGAAIRGGASLFGAVIDTVTGLPETIGTAAANLGTAIWDRLKAGFEFVRDSAGTVIGGIVGFFEGLPGKILAFVSGIGDAALKVGAEIVKKIGEGLSGAVGFASDVGNAILGFLVGGVNQVIIAPINAAIRTLFSVLDKGIPNFISDVGAKNAPQIPDIPVPAAAQGAVVLPTPGGSLIRVAEAGKPEAILPLDRLNALLTLPVAGASAAPLIAGDFIVNGADQPEKTAMHSVRELAALRFRMGG